MCAHILVAEDNANQAELVRRYLEHDGHSVVVVSDGRAAIDEARRGAPDLLLLDVMMPVVDGLDVIRVLRAESDVPIVLVTARSLEDDVLLGFDLGADDYIVKPLRPRQMPARVRVEGFITERTVDVHIMKLRRKIEHDPRRPRHLLTVYGIGYKLVDPKAV